MTDSLRMNQELLLLYEVRNTKVADGFKNNRLSLEDWCINNQSVASLTTLANNSQYLKGKNYPTSNLVIPSMYGCICTCIPVLQCGSNGTVSCCSPKTFSPR